MDREFLLRLVAERTAQPLEEVEQIVSALCLAVGETLAEGKPVELLPDLGRFLPRLNDNPARAAESPRKPRQARYTVRFRPGRELEERLKTGT